VADEPEKTAPEAARDKVERREEAEQATEEMEAGVAAQQKAAKKADPRSAQEREQDVAAGTIEPENLTETGPDSGKSTEELQAELGDGLRELLAETVTELGRKVDPRPSVEAAKETAVTTARSNAVPIAAVAGFLLVLVIWLKRR